MLRVCRCIRPALPLMAEAVFFYLFSGLTLTAALLVVASRQPVYSVLSLLLAMFSLAALFVMLGAYFVAAIQILLYAGAVLVLFLFTLMLLNLDQQALDRAKPFTQRWLAAVVVTLLALQVVGIVAQGASRQPITAVATPALSALQIGRLLLTTYLLPFELTSFIILAAIIRAVTLARSKDSE